MHVRESGRAHAGAWHSPRRVLAGAMPLVLLLTACGGSGGGSTSKSAGLTSITFRLNWIVDGQQAPWYVAQQKGFFKSHGLKVDIRPGTGSADTVQLVANDSADFGLTDAGSVLLGVSKGFSIISAGIYYQSNQFAIVARQNAGIRSVKDLEGKTFGAVPGSAYFPLFDVFAKKNGLNESSIRKVNIDQPGYQQLIKGRVDFLSTGSFAPADIENLASGKFPLTVFRASDYGIELYGLSVIVSPKMQRKPNVIRSFLDALIQGIQYSAQHPKEAIDVLLNARPELKKARAIQEEALKESLVLATPKYGATSYMGQTSGGWAATQNVLLSAGQIKKRIPDSKVWRAYSKAGVK